MTSPPTFRYSLGDEKAPVSPGSSVWESPLPMNRHHFQGSHANRAILGGFTYGDYFTAARRFLEREQFQIISPALMPERAERISDIQICLMKHGEFYHPAKIRVALRGRSRSFVLNTALSRPGRQGIDAEVSALKRLEGLSGPSYVPRVYGKGVVAICGDLIAEMFLGEWFEGFHEFHISRAFDGSQTLCAWGENDESYFLTSEEAYLLYHQAARILTLYYNMATTEHISCWHHAAGDFVIKRDLNRLSVKLITVRKYSPLLQMDKAICFSSQEGDQSMAGLLLYLLTLSIRMRLDRLDGIGDVVWADDMAVTGMWTGFLEGLEGSYFPSVPNAVVQFERYLSTYSKGDLYDLALTLVASLCIDAAEKTVVEAFIEHHIEVLCDTISRIGFP